MVPFRIYKHLELIAIIALLLNLLDTAIAPAACLTLNDVVGTQSTESSYFSYDQQLDGYTPGEDYPAYEEVPQGLSFTCADKIPGYYADPETQCQVWHWCVPGIGGNIMYSFICGPGTVFNQRTRVCDWFFKVDCPNAQAYYGVNEDLYKDEAGNFIAGKKNYSYDTKHDKRRLTARNKRQEYSKRNDKKRVNRQIRSRKYTTTTSMASTYTSTVGPLKSTSDSLNSSPLSTIHPSTIRPFRSTISDKLNSTVSPTNSYKSISSIFSSVKEIDF